MVPHIGTANYRMDANPTGGADGWGSRQKLIPPLYTRLGASPSSPFSPFYCTVRTALCVGWLFAVSVVFVVCVLGPYVLGSLVLFERIVLVRESEPLSWSLRSGSHANYSNQYLIL